MNDRTGSCYLDTNVFMGAFERPEEDAELLKGLFACFKTMPKSAVTSELTLAELLVSPSRPVESPVSVKRRFYLNLLIWSDFIDLRPVTRQILLSSAELPRAPNKKHSLPDAIHVATAMDVKCSFFMTDDKRIRGVPNFMKIVRSDAAGIATVLDALGA